MLLPQSDCCGCEVCIGVCTFGAISLEPDAAGFLYPVVDSSKCINCHACENKCPVLNRTANAYQEREFVAGYFSNPNDLKKVSSGGVASAMADFIIRSGGVVYGVQWTNDFKGAEYVRIDTTDEIFRIRGTKYVQASKHNGELYKQIKKDLIMGLLVLFIGLPCEVAAVKSFLGKNYENLYTVQLICHGATSKRFLQLFIDEIEKRNKSEVTSLTLRYKKHGVDPKYVRIDLNNGNIFEDLLLITEFGYAFVNCDRKSCYNCKFKGEHRVADMTIGDYWGVSRNDTNYNKDGVSVMVIHTDKGELLEEALNRRNDFVVFNADAEKARKGNPKMYISGSVSETRDTFIRNVNQYGLIKGAKKTYTKKDIAKIVFYKYLPLVFQRKLVEVINSFK